MATASAGPAVGAALELGAHDVTVRLVGRAVEVELAAEHGAALVAWLDGVGITVSRVRECLPRGGVQSPKRP